MILPTDRKIEYKEERSISASLTKNTNIKTKKPK